MEEDGTLFLPADRLQDSDHGVRAESISYFQDAWQRLKKNRIAMGGFYFLCVLITLAIVGPMLTDYTYYETHLHLKNTPPNGKILVWD